jgi:hypothetical protein
MIDNDYSDSHFKVSVRDIQRSRKSKDLYMAIDRDQSLTASVDTT